MPGPVSTGMVDRIGVQLPLREIYLSLTNLNRLCDDSSPAFDVTRRRFVPQRRRGDVDGRARSLLLVSRRGVLSQYVTNPVEH